MFTIYTVVLAVVIVVAIVVVMGGSVGKMGVGYERQCSPDGGPSMPSNRYDTNEPDNKPPLYDNVIMLPEKKTPLL